MACGHPCWPCCPGHCCCNGLANCANGCCWPNCAFNPPCIAAACNGPCIPCMALQRADDLRQDRQNLTHHLIDILLGQELRGLAEILAVTLPNRHSRMPLAVAAAPAPEAAATAAQAGVQRRRRRSATTGDADPSCPSTHVRLTDRLTELLAAILAEVSVGGLPKAVTKSVALGKLRIEPTRLQVLERKLLLQIVIGHHVELSLFDRLRPPARNDEAWSHRVACARTKESGEVEAAHRRSQCCALRSFCPLSDSTCLRRANAPQAQRLHDFRKKINRLSEDENLRSHYRTASKLWSSGQKAAQENSCALARIGTARETGPEISKAQTKKGI